MYQTITESDFIRAFEDMNRENNFSVEGRIALFNFFEEVDPDMELDVIAICCDYAEYANVKELKEDHSHLLEDEEYDNDEYVLDYFRDQTTTLELKSGGIIIASF